MYNFLINLLKVIISRNFIQIFAPERISMKSSEHLFGFFRSLLSKQLSIIRIIYNILLKQDQVFERPLFKYRGSLFKAPTRY